MKLLLSRDDLLEPLSRVVSVVDSRHSQQILTNILLRIIGQQLVLTASDAEIELTATRDLSTPFEQVEITVPARKLLDICRSLPETAAIELEFAENCLLMHCEKSRFRLATLPVEQFPLTNIPSSSVEINVRQCELLHLMLHTSFAIAQQDVRYYLNGLLLAISDQKIRAVATDGHRLALSELPAPAEVADINVLIPRKATTELLRLLEPVEQTVLLSLHEKHLRVVGDNFSFVTKLIDGRYPDYERVIPSGGTISFDIDKALIKQAVSRAAILANENMPGAKLQLRPGMLSIKAHNPEHEQVEEELDIVYEGEDLDIALNVNYLSDVFNVIDSETVRFQFVNASTSALIRGLGDDSTLYVLMPMRL